MSTVEELITSLEKEGREGGERSGGTFTLDRDKAREKMRLFQLPDPRAYVLELVQAAVLKGATKIRFDIDADDMRMTCDGTPFTLDDFDGIWGSLLTSVDSPRSDARRQLALGLNAAMALNPRFITVMSGDGQQGAHLEMRPGEDDRFGPLDPSSPAVEGTRIHVKQRFRPGLLVDFVRNIRGTLPEEHLLRRRCRFSTVEIDLEGTVLSNGLTLPGAIAVIPFEAEDVRGVMGLSSSHAARTVGVTFVKDGVRIATHFLEGLMPGLVAVVEGKNLRKNVSQTDIVRDEAYRYVLHQLNRNTWALLRSYSRLAMQGHESAPLDRTKSLIRWRLQRSAYIRTYQRLRNELDNDEIRFLCSVPLWTSINGAPVSLGDLIDEYEAYGSVVISSTSARVHIETERKTVVVVPNEADSKLIERLFEGNVVDWTEQIEQAQKRERNRLDWQARSTEPTLPRQRYLARTAIRGEGITGEIGLRSLPADRIRLRIIKSGCLLVEIKAPFDVLGLDVAVEADFKVTEDYDNVVADGEYGRAMDAVLHALVPLFSHVSRLKKEVTFQRVSIRSFLYAITQISARRKLLVQLGVNAKQAELLAKDHRGDWVLRPLIFPVAGKPGTLPPLYGLRYVRLFEVWNGTHVSLEDIEKELEEYGQLRVVDATVSPISDPDQLSDELWLEAERIAQQKDPDLPVGVIRRRPIVLIDKLALRLFGVFFDKTKLLEYREGCFYLGKAEYFFKNEKAKPPWIAAKVINKVQIFAVDMEGQLGLLRANESAENDGLITLFLSGHELGLAELGIPLKGLTASVNFDKLSPNLEWDGAVEDDALEEVRTSTARALGALVGRVTDVQIFDSANETLQSFLLEASTAIFPDLDLRRVYEAKLHSDGFEAAEAEHRAILELCSSASPTRVTRAVKNRLSKTATPSAESVAQGLMGLGSKAPPEILPGCMAWLDVLFPIPEGAESNSAGFVERILSPMEPLRKALLFRRHDGRPASLGQVIETYRSSGEVLYIRETARRFSAGDQLILFASDTSVVMALMCIFGEAAVREATDWLAEKKRQWHMKKKPRLDTLELSLNEALVAVPVDERGVYGQIGLDAHHPGTIKAELRVILCKDQREIGVTKDGAPAALVALINDERIVMSDDWEEIILDPGRTDRNDLLLSKLSELAEALCAEWSSLEEEQLKTAGRHALDLLVARWRDSDGDLEKLQKPPWNGLLELPLFPAVDGPYHSVETFLRRREQGHSVYYIPDEDVYGEPLEDGTIVLALSPFETRCLRDLDFLPRSNYERRWKKERAVLAWRERASQLPVVSDLRAIHRHPVDVEDVLEGELIIPKTILPLDASETVPKVFFGAEGKLIEERVASELFPCGGVLSGPRSLMTRDLETVALTAQMRRHLENAAIGLYDSLCDRFEANTLTGKRARTIARSFLATAAIQLLRTKHRHTKRFAPLYQRLERLPLLELPGGKAISLELALKERPQELAWLDLWEGTEESEEGPAAPQPPEENDTTPEKPIIGEQRDTGATPAPRAPTKREATPPAPPETDSQPAPKATPLPKPEPTSEDRLLEALRDTLKLIRDENRSLLSDFDVGRIDISTVSDKRVVVCDSWGTEINRDHHITKTIVDRFEEDPTWLYFMASTVYTALNEHLVAIVDSDEERFLTLLTRLASSGEIYL